MNDGSSTAAFRTAGFIVLLLTMVNIYLFATNTVNVLTFAIIFFALMTFLLLILRFIEKRTKTGLLDADVVDNGIETLFGKTFDDTYNRVVKQRQKANYCGTELSRNTLGWGIETYISDALAYYNASEDKAKFIEKYQQLNEQLNISETIKLLMELEILGEVPDQMYNNGKHFLIEEVVVATANGDNTKLKEYLDKGYSVVTGLHGKDKNKELRWEIYSNRVPFAEVAYRAYEFAIA
jgi:hypothetical protein